MVAEKPSWVEVQSKSARGTLGISTSRTGLSLAALAQLAQR